jgi:hypothetical protein
MKLDETTLEYLKGRKFSNSLTIHYDYRQSIPDRIRLLVDLSRGKRILHLGCLDHLPLIDAKIQKGQWLHKELTDASTRCLGVDINREAMDYVRSQYGVDNIIERDITGPVIPEIVNSKWDYVILGELLEHVDNPVSYLTEIREKYKSVVDKIIITVPNVLTKRSMRAARRSSEIINSDHRYWFSPYTIGKVMLQAGIELDEILFANRIPLTLTGLVKNKLLGWVGVNPVYNFDYAYSIVAIGQLNGNRR